METPEISLNPTTEQITQNQTWWNALSDPWKRAFNEIMLRRSVLDMPDDQVLHGISMSDALRFSGPTAPYPNMSFELEDLSGLAGLRVVRIVVVTFHKVKELSEISGLKQLSSLFVYNNQISSLEGVEGLEDLTEIYFNVNKVTSLVPLSGLTKLHTVYCNYNLIDSLDGIGMQHRPVLKNFVCLPNDKLPDEEVVRMEREIGIRCIKG